MRAAVVVVHGGAFVGGSKTAPTCVLLAQDLARRGYVGVSINYRLATGGLAAITKTAPSTNNRKMLTSIILSTVHHQTPI